MEKLHELITKELDRYPDFEEILSPINALLGHGSTNDTKLDCSKTILESIAKNTIRYLNKSLNEKSIEGFKFKKAVETMLQLLSEQTDEFELEFVEKLAPIKQLTELRNKRGDISHGHLAPSLTCSDDFTDLIVSYTSSTATYCLKIFFALDFNDLDRLKYEDDCLRTFNTELDYLYPLEGKVMYSRALFEQYYYDYIAQYEEYLDNITEEE